MLGLVAYAQNRLAAAATEFEQVVALRAARESALSFIERSLTQVDARQNVPLSIVFSLLRALALAAGGAEGEALDALDATVRRAAPLGLVRAFVDRGPRLHRLLEKLAARDGRRGHLEVLLAACEENPAAGSEIHDASLPTSGTLLSDREHDVLELAQRLSNKEIAVRLHVSSETVKKHLGNLYRKLEVHGRREAVARAAAERLILTRT
jgi:LuxR family maltose regulon positive regulatory protein